MTINERFQQIIDTKYNGNKASFAKSVGLRPSVIENVVGSRQGKPSFDVLTKICAKADVSEEWLLSGIGSMDKKHHVEESVQILHSPKSTEKMDDRFINLYDISAAANLKTLFDNKQQNIIGQISIPDIPDCDGAVNITGDSMYPLLKSGDIIAFKALDSLKGILYGEIHLVSYAVDTNEFLAVKYVNKSNIPNHVQLVSYNSHHDPMDIPLDSIDAIAIVKFSIRRHTMR